MQRFKTVAALQKFVRYHSLIYNRYWPQNNFTAASYYHVLQGY